ncbi:uncharacterized protein LOC126910333 [Daktulosphaira vitifoliae]|uniref:uncharacterized protein LOC126910333 n=1 Tax=Daktulosphaira vitifoliae TaxID=58002 RepID=UPI0021AB0704|nr:uncharacterized protein LOC126910333 [Daktulosphaira vitifoliae]
MMKKIPIFDIHYQQTVGECSNVFKPLIGDVCQISVDNVEILSDFDNSKVFIGKTETDIKLGESDCILDRGVEEILLSMCIEECKKFVLGDGNKACVSGIIKLLDVKKIKFPCTDKDRILEAEHHKKVGNDLFKQKRYIDAFHRFNKSIRYIIFLQNHEKFLSERNLLYSNLCNNMAACQIEFCNYEYAKDLLDKVLHVNSDNIKALMRRCQVSAELKMFDRTLEDARNLLTKEPNNSIGKKYEILALKELEIQNIKYKNMVKKMFC